jgi:hypothetical protein
MRPSALVRLPGNLALDLDARGYAHAAISLVNVGIRTVLKYRVEGCRSIFDSRTLDRVRGLTGARVGQSQGVGPLAPESEPRGLECQPSVGYWDVALSPQPSIAVRGPHSRLQGCPLILADYFACRGQRQIPPRAAIVCGSLTSPRNQKLVESPLRLVIDLSNRSGKSRVMSGVSQCPSTTRSATMRPTARECMTPWPEIPAATSRPSIGERTTYCLSARLSATSTGLDE